MKIIQKIHAELVFPRRTKCLTNLIANLLPKNASVLDVGCGDGIIDALIMIKRPDIKITGIDILKRKKTHVPIIIYDGKKIPFSDNNFDYILFIDVLHHTNNLIELVKEAKRVAKKGIIIKDHYSNTLFSKFILKFMDWVGNKFYQVNLPYNYLSKKQWDNIYSFLNLRKQKEINKLGLYPFPFNLIFERDYHFIVNLIKT